MSIKRRQLPMSSCLLFVFVFSISFTLQAQPFERHTNPDYWGGSDEDTILVEYTQGQKISYSRAIKAACKNLIGFDIDAYFSGGKNKRSAVIKQFDDLAERSSYRVKLDQEEITFKFSLNL